MSKTAISALQEFLAKQNKPRPIYTEIAVVHDVPPSFIIRCTCEGLDADGEGPNKKSAKHRAAGKMIELLQIKKKYNVDYWSSESSSPAVKKPFDTQVFQSSCDTLTASPGPFINHIGKLSELCVSRKMLQPTYSEIPSTVFRPAHIPEFTVECRIGSATVSRTAATKKQAKQDSAEAMRELLRNKYQILNVSENPQISQQEPPTVNELTLSIDDLKIQEAPQLETATAKAKDMYPILKKSLGVVNRDLKNVSIGNFHQVFKASFDFQTVTRFHEYWKTQTFNRRSTKEDLELSLKRICKILELTNEKFLFKTKTSDDFAVCYKLNSSPEFIEVGMGESKETAHINALIRFIATIHLLLV